MTKIYAIGEALHMSERPSLPNLVQKPNIMSRSLDETRTKPEASDSETKPYEYYSWDAAAPTNLHRHLDRFNSRTEGGWMVDEVQNVHLTNYEDKLQWARHVAAQAREQLGLDLLGLDVIFETASGKPYIIDINYFPAYTDFPNFVRTFNSFVYRRVHEAIEKNKGK